MPESEPKKDTTLSRPFLDITKVSTKEDLSAFSSKFKAWLEQQDFLNPVTAEQEQLYDRYQIFVEKLVALRQAETEPAQDDLRALIKLLPRQKIDALKKDVAPAPTATSATATPRPAASPGGSTGRRPLSAPPATLKKPEATTAAGVGEPGAPASPDHAVVEVDKKEAADIKAAMRALREAAGLQHASVQKQFPSYNKFYGSVRAFENKLTKRAAGETVSDEELAQLKQTARDHFNAFKNEIAATSIPAATDTTTTKQSLGTRFAASLKTFLGNEQDGIGKEKIDGPDTSGTPTTPEQKQWEKVAILKKDWKIKQRAFYEEYFNKSIGHDVRTLGFSAMLRHELKKEYDAAKQAYMAALAPQLQYRELREDRKGKLREGSYRPYFAQRFVLDEGNLLLEKQTEFLSPKKRELVGRLQEKLKKNRTAIRVGVVAATALVAGTGAAAVGIGLGAALGVGALAGAGKSARMLVSHGSAALIGSHVFSVLDARVDRKKDDLARRIERTQKYSYETFMMHHDAMINDYTKAYDNYRGAQTTRTVGTVAAALGTGALVGSQFDSIVDAIDRLEFVFSANDPQVLNTLPDATDKTAGYELPENLPIAENIEVPALDETSTFETSDVPELSVDLSNDTPIEQQVNPEAPAVAETENLPQEEPQLDVNRSSIFPQFPGGNTSTETESVELPTLGEESVPDPEIPPDLSELTAPTPELDVAPEPMVPPAEVPVPETGFADEALTPGGMDGSQELAGTTENQVGLMLEDLPFNVYEVHSGDPGVSYELVKQYPDIFKDLSRDEWNAFIHQVNSEPQLLQVAGVESGDLNTVFDGNQIRLDLLAEYKLNGQLPEHLSAVESSPNPPERPTDLTATVQAPTESPVPPSRPEGLGDNTTAPDTTETIPETPTAPNPPIEVVPETPEPKADLSGPDYASAPAEETTVPQWTSAAENDTVSDAQASPLPESITTAAAGVDLPQGAKEALEKMGDADKAEFADRLADNPNYTPEQMTELANLMAARAEAVDYFNQSSGIETGHGLDAVGHLKTADLIRAIENDQLQKLLIEYKVSSPSVAETISLMHQCRLLSPGTNLNEALERAFMENSMHYNQTGDELVLLKAGLFGPKELEVTLTNPQQQYA